MTGNRGQEQQRLAHKSTWGRGPPTFKHLSKEAEGILVPLYTQEPGAAVTCFRFCASSLAHQGDGPRHPRRLHRRAGEHGCKTSGFHATSFSHSSICALPRFRPRSKMCAHGCFSQRGGRQNISSTPPPRILRMIVCAAFAERRKEGRPRAFIPIPRQLFGPASSSSSCLFAGVLRREEISPVSATQDNHTSKLPRARGGHEKG